MKVVYRFKDKARVPVKAEVAGRELDRICERNNGHLTPGMVVKAARPKNAPLHPCFEWDDKRAAHLYREDQARYLIRSVVVEMPEAGEDRSCRAFVNVERDGDTDYTTLARVLSDADLRQQVVQRAWRELEAWRERYHEYEELADIFAAMDQEKAA